MQVAGITSLGQSNRPQVVVNLGLIKITWKLVEILLDEGSI